MGLAPKCCKYHANITGPGPKRCKYHGKLTSSGPKRCIPCKHDRFRSKMLQISRKSHGSQKPPKATKSQETKPKKEHVPPPKNKNGTKNNWPKIRDHRNHCRTNWGAERQHCVTRNGPTVWQGGGQMQHRKRRYYKTNSLHDKIRQYGATGYYCAIWDTIRNSLRHILREMFGRDTSLSRDTRHIRNQDR